MTRDELKQKRDDYLKNGGQVGDHTYNKFTSRMYYMENKEKICEHNRSMLAPRENTADQRVAAQTYRRLTYWISKGLQGRPHQRNTLPLTQILGCTQEVFRNHLEAQFAEGMTWDTFRINWTIRFLKPVSTFDCAKFSGLLGAFHFLNIAVNPLYR